MIFFGHGLDAKFRYERPARGGVTSPALIDSVRVGEPIEEVRKRLGKPTGENSGTRIRRERQGTGNAGTTTHLIEPMVEARIVRLNVTRASYSGEPIARIFEFEVYGPDGRENFALRRPRHWKSAVQPGFQTPEKAVNGSVERRLIRQVVRSRLADVPAGGSGRGSSSDPVRREARQCGRRE